LGSFQFRAVRHPRAKAPSHVAGSKPLRAASSRRVNTRASKFARKRTGSVSESLIRASLSPQDLAVARWFVFLRIRASVVVTGIGGRLSNSCSILVEPGRKAPRAGGRSLQEGSRRPHPDSHPDGPDATLGSASTELRATSVPYRPAGAVSNGHERSPHTGAGQDFFTKPQVSNPRSWSPTRRACRRDDLLISSTSHRVRGCRHGKGAERRRLQRGRHGRCGS
jgi:hypothetical protein